MDAEIIKYNLFEELVKVKRLPQISKQAFWDVDIDLHSEKTFKTYSHFIIEKVFEYGSFDETLEIIIYYGFNKTKKNLKKVNLSDRTIDFCCVIFNLKREDFKCYMKRQLIPKLWNY